MGFIDLHTHSTYSDGSLTPSGIVSLAESKGLLAVALTDHDTVDGIEEFLSCRSSIFLVPGVEISCQHGGVLHILGYFVDHRSCELVSFLEWMRGSRERRNLKILEKLRAMGIDVDMEEVKREAGEEVIGRPHIAKLLVRKGYVSSMKEAFERFLGRGRPCYVDREKPTFYEAVDVIRKAGGLPVLAHPFSLGLERGTFKAFVARMVDLGLEGIEVYYPEHTPEDVRFFLSVADEFHLLVTGGSDFHGTFKPEVDLGMLDVPFDLYVSLVKRWEEIHEAEQIFHAHAEEGPKGR